MLVVNLSIIPISIVSHEDFFPSYFVVQAVMECIRVSMEDMRSESSSSTKSDVDKTSGGSF